MAGFSFTNFAQNIWQNVRLFFRSISNWFRQEYDATQRELRDQVLTNFNPKPPKPKQLAKQRSKLLRTQKSLGTLQAQISEFDATVRSLPEADLAENKQLAKDKQTEITINIAGHSGIIETELAATQQELRIIRKQLRLATLEKRKRTLTPQERREHQHLAEDLALIHAEKQTGELTNALGQVESAAAKTGEQRTAEKVARVIDTIGQVDQFTSAITTYNHFMRLADNDHRIPLSRSIEYLRQAVEAPKRIQQELTDITDDIIQAVRIMGERQQLLAEIQAKLLAYRIQYQSYQQAPSEENRVHYLQGLINRRQAVLEVVNQHYPKLIELASLPQETASGIKQQAIMPMRMQSIYAQLSKIQGEYRKQQSADNFPERRFFNAVTHLYNLLSKTPAKQANLDMAAWHDPRSPQNRRPLSCARQLSLGIMRVAQKLPATVDAAEQHTAFTQRSLRSPRSRQPTPISAMRAG